MDKENTRNTIIFFVCALALMTLYQVFVLGPNEKRQAAERTARAAYAVVHQNAPAEPTGPVFLNRDQALAQSMRIPIDTPALKGSIALKGGRIDDLYIKGYAETLAKDSPPVELFRPEGARNAYFTDFGWAGGPSTVQVAWTAPPGQTLSVGHPVSLTYDTGQGLVFTRTIAVDDKYLFTVTDTAANKGSAPVQLAPYASVQRQGSPTLTPGTFEGAVGSINDLLNDISFKDMKAKGGRVAQSDGGWVGLTDKYWLAALIPAKAPMKATYGYTNISGVDVYEANYLGPPRTLAPGASSTVTLHLFAGAKKSSILETYQKQLGLTHLIDAIDWGVLWFLTRPVFWVLSQFIGLTGSVGVAILLLTMVRVLMTFPLYNRSFASSAEMRKLQPEVEFIRAQNKDDPAKAQQAIMELYKERKVNFVAGCLPALVPIPIFFALTKVFTVAIEMRHAAFMGVPDLSAPEPTTFVNLFGLIPWNVGATPGIGGILDGQLHIGLIAILYGCTQWLFQAMSPTTTGVDPVQKQMFALMPVIMIFFMAHVASGLLIYWVWSTLLTIIQQYVIMHRHRSENPIDTFIERLRGRSLAIKV
jgi:YidC/Oxa1 family membrane protein insertase